MTASDWLSNLRDFSARYPVPNATRAAVLSAWQGVARRAGSRAPEFGTSVWSRDWDVLVLLDACRPDALAAVADEYAFLPSEIPTMMSRASWSRAWMYDTFAPENRAEVGQTSYVTGNVFTREFGSDGIADADWFDELHEAWRDGWDAEQGTVPPRAITDPAIDVWRSGADQMILHYMQPHAPYRSLDINGHEHPDAASNHTRRTVWDDLQAGTLSTAEAWDAMLDNLRWALDDVELLLENIDAERVVLSADHAELFGEIGLYSHPDVPIPRLRRVPWVVTSATDEETHTPTPPQADASVTDDAITDRLEALGYA